ncbi:helicase [Sorochytrium milnesiophthora]
MRRSAAPSQQKGLAAGRQPLFKSLSLSQPRLGSATSTVAKPAPVEQSDDQETSTESVPAAPVSRGTPLKRVKLSTSTSEAPPQVAESVVADGDLSCFNVLCLGKSSQSFGTLSEGETIVFGGREIEISGIISASDYQSGKCFRNGKAPETGLSLSGSMSKGAFVNKGFRSHATDLSSAAGGRPASPAMAPRVPQPRHDPLAPGAVVMPRPLAEHQRLFNRPKRHIVDVVLDPVLSVYLRPHQHEGVRFLYECTMQMKDYDGSGAILADEMGLGKTVQTISLIWTLLKQNPYYGDSVIKRALIVCPASLVNNWEKEFKKWLGDERVRVFPVQQKTNVRDFLAGRIYSVMIVGYEKLRAIQDLLKDGGFDLIVCDEGHRLKSAQIKTSMAIRSIPTKRRVILSGTPIQNDLAEYFAMVDFVNPGVLGSYQAFKNIYEEPIVRGRQSGASAAERELGETRSEELSRLTGMFVLRRTAEINVKYLPKKTEDVVFCRLSELQLSVYRALLASPFFRKTYNLSTATYADAEASGQNVLVCITLLKKLCNAAELLFAEDGDSLKADDSQSKSPTATKRKREEDGDASDASDMEAEYDFIDRSLSRGILDEALKLAKVKVSKKKCLQDESGKIAFLRSLVNAVFATSDEKVVVVSNFTQTLDILSRFFKEQAIECYRLDGSTPSGKRQKLVDDFNKPTNAVRVFLLSSKAGGVGLNLVGASRLVLYDIDWNPSVDLQAMSRIWRDGQTRPVRIYRLLSTGSIEEKIYQRQLTKQGLSAHVLGDAKGGGVQAQKSSNNNNQFTDEELKAIFTLHETTDCYVHDSIKCKCGGERQQSQTAESQVIEQWSHYSHEKFVERADAEQHLLAAVAEQGPDVVSFVIERE